MRLEADDVNVAFDWVADVCANVPADRWDTAEPPAWTARRTLDHMVDAMLLYDAYVSTRARERVAPPRDGDPNATPGDLLMALRAGTATLVAVLSAMTDEERAFHPSGNADRTGWIGMACTELLVHGADIATLAGLPINPPNDLADSVVDRVLPWTPREGTGWDRLLWATGRAALGARPLHGADWWWQSAPLEEWDGTPNLRTAPPQW